MGEGGRRSAIQELTWSEVQKHVSRDDRWIVVDGEVYDVTHWSRKHPGGSRLIGHYAGQDATYHSRRPLPGRLNFEIRKDVLIQETPRSRGDPGSFSEVQRGIEPAISGL
ncbi:hypothetical protein DPMN_186786 [Dreissena polymorpha]|uniref:Cytochrome b5 heme-binding domain-containing protein n=1 Tax=Dreissena polymorpha TaxID=45954 RepID=A0A9D4DMU0_DREPO|nr:hypothetical protein DPMN_186786 [Dreissena polymorpha]